MPLPGIEPATFSRFPSTMDEARALFFENVPVEREEAEDQKEGVILIFGIIVITGAPVQEAADNDSAPETSAAERTRPVPCRGRIPHSAIHFTVGDSFSQLQFGPRF